MQYVVDVRIHDREASQPYIPGHIAYLNAYFESGDILCFGGYDDGTGGMMIVRADSPEALEKLLAADPLKDAGCAEWFVKGFAMKRACDALVEAK